MKQISLRLKGGQDLRKELEGLVSKHNIQAGALLSVVGSLNKAKLRLADGATVKGWNADFEIVSGTGTLSPDDCHIHIVLADKKGNTIGGHLKEGCVVKTTVEIVVLVFDDVKYKRILNKETGYEELEIAGD